MFSNTAQDAHTPLVFTPNAPTQPLASRFASVCAISVQKQEEEGIWSKVRVSSIGAVSFWISVGVAASEQHKIILK